MLLPGHAEITEIENAWCMCIATHAEQRATIAHRSAYRTCVPRGEMAERLATGLWSPRLWSAVTLHATSSAVHSVESIVQSLQTRLQKPAHHALSNRAETTPMVGPIGQEAYLHYGDDRSRNHLLNHVLVHEGGACDGIRAGIKRMSDWLMQQGYLWTTLAEAMQPQTKHSCAWVLPVQVARAKAGHTGDKSDRL